MASVRSQNVICRIVKNGILELETKAGHIPVYNAVMLIEETLLVIDRDGCNLQLYNHHDGKLITSQRLESIPRDVCRVSKNKVAVCLADDRIVILSFKSIEDVKLVKTLKTGFCSGCHSLVKLNSDKLVVSGWKDDIMLWWGVLTIRDGHLESTHNICQGIWTHMIIKDNTLFISCYTEDSITNGLYAYDLFNPHTHTFLYQHHDLKVPWSILSDRNCVYVFDYNSSRIHQLTDSGQLVTIHTVSSRLNEIFYDDQHGLLYTTGYESNVITVYKMEYLHQPDSEQDYKLQRLVKVINDNCQTGGRVLDSELDAISNQRETTDGNPLSRIADDNKNTEVLYRRCQQRNVGQNVSSTSSLQKKSSSHCSSEKSRSF